MNILGSTGEKKAAKFLKNKGYKILETNYKNKTGEIDIIAKDGETIVFAEVKTRSSAKFGKGFEAVNYKKTEKITNTALMYMAEKGQEASCRFDVISIDGGEITHIVNAF